MDIIGHQSYKWRRTWQGSQCRTRWLLVCQPEFLPGDFPWRRTARQWMLQYGRLPSCGCAEKVTVTANPPRPSSMHSDIAFLCLCDIYGQLFLIFPNRRPLFDFLIRNGILCLECSLGGIKKWPGGFRIIIKTASPDHRIKYKISSPPAFGTRKIPNRRGEDPFLC